MFATGYDVGCENDYGYGVSASMREKRGVTPMEDSRKAKWKVRSRWVLVQMQDAKCRVMRDSCGCLLNMPYYKLICVREWGEHPGRQKAPFSTGQGIYFSGKAA